MQAQLAGARRALPFAWGVLATMAGMLLFTWLFPGQAPLTLSEVNESVAQAMASASAPPAYSAQVYQIIQPSLVLIQTRSNTSSDDSDGGLGTGVVVGDDGTILTALHVVLNAAEIRLTFADGSQTTGQVIAAQPENDIAVLAPLQLPEVLVPAVLGNPYGMSVGDEAFAVGHPMGLYASMSAGVISGFDRSFRPSDGQEAIDNLIQIDAAVNPGNSGGPLLNRAGQVVGIVVALLNPTEQDFFVGIGFAVPIDVAGGAAGLPEY